jgi:hypothetical protein
LCVVAEGAFSDADELVRREQSATSGPAIGSGDREAFDAYEGELQQMLAEARRDRPEPSNASQGSGRPVVGALAGTISTPLAGTPPGPSSASPSRHSQRAALAAENSSSRAMPAAQPIAVATINISGPNAAPSAQCRFFQPGAERTTADDCMSCHGMSQTHPVDLDYAAAAARRPGFYRSREEVVRRGVLLPGGQIKCVTCHDPQSPWKDKIALPPGAAAMPAVDLARPETYERPRSRTAADAHLPAGSAVTPTPLCQSCHTYGD